MIITVAGYQFQADTYCTTCIYDVLPTGEGQAFDGWGMAPESRTDPETDLTELALAFGIDRFDENTFDSSEFPKVIHQAPWMEQDPTECGICRVNIFE